jgi:hypothetical protein
MTRTFPDVQGHCPACGASSLFVADAGYITCSRLECPDPGAAARLLDLAAPPPGPVHPGDARHRRVTAALTAEHYRRARERIVASPEDHSAAAATVALRVLADDLLPATRTPRTVSAGHPDTRRADTADTGDTPPTRKDSVRTAIARAFDIPAELLDAPPDTDTPGQPDTDTSADMSAVRDLLAHWQTAGPPPLGTSINRWWDRRLVELATALATPGARQETR